MNDYETAANRVAFMCEQCQRPVQRVINYGQHWGEWRFQVECHNESMHVEVDELSLKAVTKDAPFVMTVFAKKRTQSNEPNVRFWCPKCDAVSDVFQSQYDHPKDEHVFMVTCHGRVCKGKRTFARCRPADFQALRNVKSPIPQLILLEPWIHLSPVHVTHPANAAPKVAPKVVVVTVERPRRKLRLQ